LPSVPLNLEICPDAEYVGTGAPLPDWADAVIPIENVESLDERGEITKEIRKPKTIRTAIPNSKFLTLSEVPVLWFFQTVRE